MGLYQEPDVPSNDGPTPKQIATCMQIKTAIVFNQSAALLQVKQGPTTNSFIFLKKLRFFKT